MRKFLVVAALASVLTLGFTAPAFADPSGHTGPPTQSCQAYSPSTRPGNSGSSPGAPFNEPGGVDSTKGGTGGANYSANSQYTTSPAFSGTPTTPNPRFVGTAQS